MLSIKKQRPPVPYRGRFAPSPSGLLHFGSLISALASYLDAKHNQGEWLVRMEDIDPPREMVGANKAILETLYDFGLHWDGDVMYQSDRSLEYRQLINDLMTEKKAYTCQCTRAKIKASGGIYLGTCRDLQLPTEHNAIRVINTEKTSLFTDKIQGKVQCNLAQSAEDFVILRRDGLFAYQLAVVVDDIAQGITHVVRGCDLLEPTIRQISFIRQLGYTAPQYAHIPLAVTDQGYKLSKQNKAPAIDRSSPQPALIKALAFLGQQPPPYLLKSSVANIISWAIEHWQQKQVPRHKEIIIAD